MDSLMSATLTKMSEKRQATGYQRQRRHQGVAVHPEADVLTLQRFAGNQAVSQLLKDRENRASIQQNPKSSTFVLAESPLGKAISSGLRSFCTSSEGESPRISPDQVLAELASSERFCQIARLLNDRYYISGAKPQLSFVFHDNPDAPNEFDRSRGLVQIRVTYLDETVETIVHELVHASHDRPKREQQKGAGAVTLAEKAGILEEVQTREESRQILGEIVGSKKPKAPQKSVAEKARIEDEVRMELVTGLPRLTYQEFYIITEMQRQTRPNDLSDVTEALLKEQLLKVRSLPKVQSDKPCAFAIPKERLKSWRKQKAEPPVKPSESSKEAPGVQAVPETSPGGLPKEHSRTAAT